MQTNEWRHMVIMKNRIGRKILAVLTAIAMMVSAFGVAYAANVEIKTSSGITYAPLSDGTVAVSECNGLTGSVVIPSQYNGKTVSQIGEMAFLGCDGITSVTIPETVKVIGDYAFEGCEKLETIKLPAGLESIGSRAFASSGIKKIEIGAAVSEIKTGAFTSCENLTEIKTDASNKYYTTRGGVLFDIQQKTLISYPCAQKGTYTLPVSVEEIAEAAFEGAKGLTGITINYGLQKIGSYAFASSALKSVNIPVSVSKIEEGAFCSCTDLEQAVWPYSASEIETYVFAYSGLKSVSIPEGVDTVGDMAFFECSALESVDLPDSLKVIGTSAFRSCSKLETVTIPANVAEIGNNAFMYASSLKSANFLGVPPKTFGGNVFSNANSEFKVGYIKTNASAWAPNGETIWNGYPLVMFENDGSALPVDDNFEYTLSGDCATITEYKGEGGDVKVPETIGNNYSVTAIGDYAFAYSKATTITVPDSVTTIGNEAFRDCLELTKITLGKGVSAIGVAVFAGSSKLAEISVSADNANYQSIDGAIYTKDGAGFIACPVSASGTYTVKDGVINIAASAFESCKGLTKIVLPSSVATIGNYAFFECTSLKDITLSNNVKTLGNSAFYLCTSLETIVLPSSLKKLEDSLMYGCTSLKNIYIQQGVEAIGYAAFSTCTALESITLPKGMKQIEENAFSDCSALTTVYISDTVGDIAGYAFRNCKKLENAIFYGEPPTIFGENVFEGASDSFKIYYPKNYALSWAPNGETTWNGYPIAPVEDSALPTPTPTSTPDATPTPGTTPGGTTLQGDVTGDGNVNSRDIAAMQKHILGTNVLEGELLAAGDMTGDGKINSRDIAALQKKILG